MKQTGAKQPSVADEQTERVVRALEETDRAGRAPASIRDDPGRFLRDLYEVWHRQGGKEGGRPRNSIRKMRDQWLVGRQAVPSLHPKLMGRIKVTRADARAMIDLFLTRWRYADGDEPVGSMTRDRYIAFPTADPKRLRDHLVHVLFASGGGTKGRSILLPELAAKSRVHGMDLRVQSFLGSEYRQCDALITFSRNRIAVGPNPAETMKNFFFLLNGFYEDDQRRQESKCIFIWVVDLGRRLFEDDRSFREFYNAGFLALLLQAFAMFDSEQDSATGQKGRLFRELRIFDPTLRRQRWKWLVERSVVIAENLRWEEFGGLYGDEERDVSKIRLRDSGITAQHILPLETPANWNSSLKRLVGRKFNLGDITFTTLINKNGWEERNERKYQKYFAHARTLKDADIGISNARSESIELPYAGRQYEEASRIVYLSALYRLRRENNLESEEMTAFAYLRKLGFNALRIDDFIKILSIK